jgi:hypothetical protein
MLYKLSLVAALTVALAYSSPTLAQGTQGMTMHYGNHAPCKEGGKKGGCMHHYTGHHACKQGGKKGGCTK